MIAYYILYKDCNRFAKTVKITFKWFHEEKKSNQNFINKNDLAQKFTFL